MSKFTIYQDAAGEWRWRLTADNGEPVADSGEGYTERNDAVEAAHRLGVVFRPGFITYRITEDAGTVTLTIEEPDE